MTTNDPRESFPYLLVNLWSVSVLVPGGHGHVLLVAYCPH